MKITKEKHKKFLVFLIALNAVFLTMNLSFLFGGIGSGFITIGAACLHSFLLYNALSDYNKLKEEK